MFEAESEYSRQFQSIYISLDKRMAMYERRVTTFADVLGNLGGLYEIFLIAGQMAIGIFSERLFISSIIHKIYQIDQD